MRRTLPLLPLILLPLILLRGGLAPGSFPGQPFGEGWGRLFAMGQVSRWISLETTIGSGDLLAYPDSKPFWPIDPLSTGVGAVFRLLAGGGPEASAAALGLTFLLLLTLTGLGAWLLARSLGAGPWSACAVGMVLQLHPYLLRNAADSVTEVLALGPALLLGAAAVHAWRGGRHRGWLLGAAGLATALTSPYYAVYATLVWGLLIPWALWRRSGARWLAGGAVLLVAGGLAAAPLLWAERGPEGRMAERFADGGFQLAPSGQVILALDGTQHPARPGRGAARRGGAASQDGPATQGGPPPLPLRLIQRFPGGLACALALILGLITRRSRPLALLALALFATGAGPQLISHTLALKGEPAPAVLQTLLGALPLTDRLGNVQRMVLLYAIPALLAGGIATRGRGGWVALLALLALGEAWLNMPWLRLPATEVSVDSQLLAAVRGPVVTFPVGDAPVWNANAAPKRNLFLASLHGAPVAGDYGRGRWPADLDLVATLSAWSGTALAPPAADRVSSRGLPADDPPGFERLLVLHETLGPKQRDRLHRHAQARWGDPVAISDWGAVYTLRP
jgi:hypothetical protein